MTEIDIDIQNRLDPNYQDLCAEILDYGTIKKDRTGTGTISIFGTEIRHDMRTGFPLLTTKKMFLRGISVEMEWFLQGGTNIKYLVNKNVNIWNGDAYKNFQKMEIAEFNRWKHFNSDILANFRPLSMEDYIQRIKEDAKFAEKYANLGPIYGHQWRKAGADFTSADGMHSELRMSKGFDQLGAAIKTLFNDPDNRRIKVDAWAPNEVQYMALPPCHTDFQLYTRILTLDERLNAWHKRFPGQEAIPTHEFLNTCQFSTRGLYLKWQQRSVDTFLGLPFNIASYGLLLEIIARQVNMIPLDLIGSLGDTHIYLNHIEQCREQISRDYFNLPTLRLPDNVTIDNFDYSMLTLENYQAHPPIKGDISN